MYIWVVQAVACIGVIIAGGRTLLRPIYRRMADMGNTDVFAATTLLVVLGTSVLTQIAGLSLALGAFLVRDIVPIKRFVVLTTSLLPATDAMLDRRNQGGADHSMASLIKVQFSMCSLPHLAILFLINAS